MNILLTIILVVQCTPLPSWPVLQIVGNNMTRCLVVAKLKKLELLNLGEVYIVLYVYMMTF